MGKRGKVKNDDMGGNTTHLSHRSICRDQEGKTVHSQPAEGIQWNHSQITILKNSSTVEQKQNATNARIHFATDIFQWPFILERFYVPSNFIALFGLLIANGIRGCHKGQNERHAKQEYPETAGRRKGPLFFYLIMVGQRSFPFLHIPRWWNGQGHKGLTNPNNCNCNYGFSCHQHKQPNQDQRKLSRSPLQDKEFSCKTIIDKFTSNSILSCSLFSCDKLSCVQSEFPNS